MLLVTNDDFRHGEWAAPVPRSAEPRRQRRELLRTVMWNVWSRRLLAVQGAMLLRHHFLAFSTKAESCYCETF